MCASTIDNRICLHVKARSTLILIVGLMAGAVGNGFLLRQDNERNDTARMALNFFEEERMDVVGLAMQVTGPDSH